MGLELENAIEAPFDCPWRLGSIMHKSVPAECKPILLQNGEEVGLGPTGAHDDQSWYPRVIKHGLGNPLYRWNINEYHLYIYNYIIYIYIFVYIHISTSICDNMGFYGNIMIYGM